MNANNKEHLARREFLKWVSLLGISGTLAACRAKSFISTPTLSELLQKTANATKTATELPKNTPQQSLGETEDVTQEYEAIPELSKTSTVQPTPDSAYLAAARGSNIESIVFAALAAIGGIEKFVPQNADVIIKPNICCNYYSSEYAATTNPEVIAALVRLCLGAGARRVRVMDQPFAGSPESAYSRSGIADAVAASGGEMEIMNWNKYVTAEIPNGLDLKEWVFYKPILDADVLIDVPIAKHHGLAGLTLGGKNLLGTISNPAGIHKNFGQRIADLVSKVRPTLTVVDAVRILMENGPTGGNLNDVKKLDTVIASQDIIAADAYAAALFGKKGSEISYIKAGAEMGLGRLDLEALRIEEINL